MCHALSLARFWQVVLLVRFLGRRAVDHLRELCGLKETDMINWSSYLCILSLSTLAWFCSAVSTCIRLASATYHATHPPVDTRLNLVLDPPPLLLPLPASCPFPPCQLIPLTPTLPGPPPCLAPPSAFPFNSPPSLLHPFLASSLSSPAPSHRSLRRPPFRHIVPDSTASPSHKGHSHPVQSNEIKFL